jgi:hypothetical protein
MRKILVLLATIFASLGAFASGHGPVFGYATPTNSQGEFSFDLGMSGRSGEAGNDLSARFMASYGFTPHLMLSVIAPAPILKAPMTPTRLMTDRDFESQVSWRFHHNAAKVGTRFESTAFASVIAPGADASSGVMGMLKRAPGFSGGAATGIASRSNYLWLGGGFARFLERDGDRRPNVFSYSLVYGYRPLAWRKDTGWDWRLFAEMGGEKSTSIQHFGVQLPGSEANQVFLGPSVLGIRENYAIEGGVQLPVYRNVGSVLVRERVRWVINVSYFLFQHSKHSH